MYGVVGLLYRVTKLTYRRTQLGSWTIEGDSPVNEMCKTLSSILSRTGHEKSCLNLRRPLRKPKYYLITDSEPVP